MHNMHSPIEGWIKVFFLFAVCCFSRFLVTCNKRTTKLFTDTGGTEKKKKKKKRKNRKARGPENQQKKHTIFAYEIAGEYKSTLHNILQRGAQEKSFCACNCSIISLHLGARYWLINCRRWSPICGGEYTL